MVDVDGGGAQEAQAWAMLEGLTSADPVCVRAYDSSVAGEGYFVLGSAQPAPYLSLDRTGVWFDTNQDGVRDIGEQNANLSGPTNGFFTVDGVNMETQDVTLRVVDLKVATPLDLAGFSLRDQIVFDVKTAKNDWYGWGSLAFWNDSSRPAVPTGAINTVDGDRFTPGNVNSTFLRTTSIGFLKGAAGILVNQRVFGYASTASGKIKCEFSNSVIGTSAIKLPAPFSD